MTIEEYEALMTLIRSERESEGATLADKIEKPKKRKRSKYNRELSKQLNILKKKHPRTKQTALMTKAHAATRKVLKMPKKRKK
jgi:hypothetical protein